VAALIHQVLKIGAKVFSSLVGGRGGFWVAGHPASGDEGKNPFADQSAVLLRHAQPCRSDTRRQGQEKVANHIKFAAHTQWSEFLFDKQINLGLEFTDLMSVDGVMEKVAQFSVARVVNENQFVALHFDDRLRTGARFQIIEKGLAAQAHVFEHDLRVVVAHDSPKIRPRTPMHRIRFACGAINRIGVGYSRQGWVEIKARVDDVGGGHLSSLGCAERVVNVSCP
jgi:hypothetical protein